MSLRTFLVCWAMVCASAQAQVVIYSLSLSSTGPSLNYEALERGYTIVDTDSGSFSSIMILKDPANNKRYYTTSLLSGTYYDLVEEGTGDLFGVMTSGAGASSGNSTLESLAMQVVGKASRTSVGGGASLRIPRRMTGFLLANSEEATSVDSQGLPQVEYGFAGFSRVTARFDGTSTRDANNARLSASATVTAITKNLEKRGIGPEPTPTPSPSPSPTPTP